jgi:hypothetical protein
MNDYTKGILTGASLILCFFMFVSAKSQSRDVHFGEITADSIQLNEGVYVMGGENNNTVVATLVADEFNGGRLWLFSDNHNDKFLDIETPNIKISANELGAELEFFNDNKEVLTMGQNEHGGYLEIYDISSRQMVATITAADSSGYIELLDFQDDRFWSPSNWTKHSGFLKK